MVEGALVRRAKAQHDPETGPKQQHTRTTDYNLWYGKSSGAREQGRDVQKESVTRCIARMDSGRTRGRGLHSFTFSST